MNNNSDDDFILFNDDNETNYEDISEDEINFTNLSTTINTPPPPPLYHDTPPSPTIDNSPHVNTLSNHFQNLNVYVPPPPPPQRRAPTPFPTPREPQTPTDFLINQIIDREFEEPEPLQQQLPEHIPAPPDLNEIILNKQRMKIYNRNYKHRRKEKKKFNDFYQTLTLNEYQIQDLVQKYNAFRDN